ncbi:MAG: ankyrin repeat domain-containing protein [Pseudomonadota bacterium]
MKDQLEKIASFPNTIKFIYKFSDKTTRALKINFAKRAQLEQWLAKDQPILPLVIEYIKEQIDIFCNFYLETKPSSSDQKKMVKYQEEIKRKIDDKSNREIVINHIKYNILRLIDKENPEDLESYIKVFIKKLREEDGFVFSIDDPIFSIAPLQYASDFPYSDKQIKIINLLLSEGASVDTESKYDNTTALHKAVCNENAALVKLLASKGADPNKKSIDGFTPFYQACEIGNYKMVEFLLNKADLNIKTNNGDSPLRSVCRKNHTEIVKLILNKALDLLAQKVAPKDLELFEQDVDDILKVQGFSEVVKKLLKDFVQKKEKLLLELNPKTPQSHPEVMSGERQVNDETKEDVKGHS